MLLPLFPLPNVVLLPGVLLPLHIFEPRYRAMVADALEADRRIGMVLLRPGWESDYEGRPPVFAIGCSGVMVHAARLEDGRYNIVLRGLDRFRILGEDHALPYRRAEVVPLPDPAPDDRDQNELHELRQRLVIQLVPAQAEPLASMPDADFIHTLAQFSHLEPIEKQALLECENLSLRARSFVELVEITRLASKMPDVPKQTH